MKIHHRILNNLIKNNNGMKLILRDDSSTLDIYISNNLVLTLKLENGDIESNSEFIYNSIINLENVNMYIPKIYIKED
ncbi:hypothetical protein EAI30_05895 [Romboutsia ilealis]|uniref:Uncharacterized protein n=1 Tax=Romboutsia faecis TaxID=2764597 RepID=A0ABR7JNZ4_9FIRM|nr:hypothetical protein [Romboutsia faecis]MBC5996618.1 hypothetical protein [Romboutsia faecis]MRN24144.1 hypothetical protein [Romboutsia ilealis]